MGVTRVFPEFPKKGKMDVASDTTDSATPQRKYSRDAINEKLRELQAKKNKMRGAAKHAIEDERKKEIGHDNKKEEREAKLKEEKFKQSLTEQGIDPERYMRLHTTLEVEDQKEKKKQRRANPGDIDAFGEEAQYRAFKKRRNGVQFDQEAYQRQKDALGDDFYDCNAAVAYGVDTQDDPSKVLELVDEMHETENRRKNFSRRRRFDEEADVNSINERNRKFNEKIGRYYNSYTTELRENLERGTAL